MEVNSPNKRNQMNVVNVRETRKRSLNNASFPNAKRARKNRTLRFSNANNVRIINSEGRGLPVVDPIRTGRKLKGVPQRSLAEKKQAINVGQLSANVSSRHDTLNNMTKNAILIGQHRKLPANTIQKTIGHLRRIYGQYQRNLDEEL